MAKNKRPKQSTPATPHGRTERLNDVIRRHLWAPSGDPSHCYLSIAADAYVSLKSEGLPVANEQDVIDVLRRDNIEKRDYLASAMTNPPLPAPVVGKTDLPACKINTEPITRQLAILAKHIDNFRAVPAKDSFDAIVDILDFVHAALEGVVDVIDAVEVAGTSPAVARPGQSRPNH